MRDLYKEMHNWLYDCDRMYKLRKNHMRPDKIRPIALCVLIQNDTIFVTEFGHPDSDTFYYRPLGGGIEFGEYALDALRREMREEINAEIDNVKFIGVLENIFSTSEGNGHEICMMFSATFAEAERHHPDYQVTGIEEGGTFHALWKPLSMFRNGDAPLFPDGLLTLINNFTD